MTNLHDLTAQVVAALDFDDLDELVIFDHGSDDPASIAWLERIELEEKVNVDRRGTIPEESLYRAWNDTVRRALDRFDSAEVDVVLLNNDVTLPRGFIGCLTRALRSGDPRVAIAYPDVSARMEDGVPRTIQLTATKGLAADGGLTGWAFALKAEAFRTWLPYIDERLLLYSGDRDLIFNVESAGHHAARVVGLPCGHVVGATRKKRPELREQQRRDIELWWGQGKMRN